jgi:hypothetical protein
MTKLFAELKARFDREEKFETITIDCNQIVCFYKTSIGTTEVTFNTGTLEVEMDYYEFKQNIMGEILKVEHQNDILKLMAGYLSNHITANISAETLIKDCKGIIKKIASDNNNL